MTNWHRKRIVEYALGDRERLTEVLFLVRGCKSYKEVWEIIKQKPDISSLIYKIK